MNSPRLKLSGLPRRSTPQGTNGSAPTVRPREPLPSAAPASPGRAGTRRLLQPLPAAGIALVLIALVGYLGVYSASDVRSGGIAAEASVLAALLPAGERSQAVGQRLSTPVPAGAPLPAGALAGRQAQTSAFTLAVPEFDLTAGLQAGDRVTVLATFGAGSGQAVTRPIARNVEVLSVGEAPANADPSTATVPVAIAVSEPSSASELALANEDAKLDVLIEGSSASTAAIPQASQGSAP
jgi:hypothetical protein